MTYKLLFVCLGNICRSPSGENIMNHLLAEKGYSHLISCDSAGTANYHVGASPDRRMTAAANRKGIEMIGSARQFIEADFAKFDLILAMDKDNYRDIFYLDREGKYKDKVRLMCEFARHHSEKEVPDPYYGGKEGFDRVIDLLIDACEGLLENLINTGRISIK